MAGGCEPGGDGPAAPDAIGPAAQGAVAPVAPDVIGPAAQGAVAPVAPDVIGPVAHGAVADGAVADGAVALGAPAPASVAVAPAGAGGELDPETVELIAQIRQLAAEDPNGVQQIIAEVLAALDRVTGATPQEP